MGVCEIIFYFEWKWCERDSNIIKLTTSSLDDDLLMELERNVFKCLISTSEDNKIVGNFDIFPNFYENITRLRLI